VSPPLAITQPDGSRRYVHPLTSETVPSVTSILKVIDKPALQFWGARIAADHAWDNREQLALFPEREFKVAVRDAHKKEAEDAAGLGTLIHSLCEQWGGEIPVEIPRRADSYMSQYFSFLSDVQPEFLLKECTLWNRTASYAGTADAIVMIGRECWVLDIKTGRGIYPEHGLQLTALGFCEFQIQEDGTELEMPPVTRYAVLHLRPKSWKLVEIKYPAECFAAFLACRELYYWQTMISPLVLGDPR